ncbi:DNA ligase [Amphritea atlantica]|nr:DNA ligase [Amphritea atlantica]
MHQLNFLLGLIINTLHGRSPVYLLREGEMVFIRYCHILFSSLIVVVSFLVVSPGFADKPKLQLATIYQSGSDISAYWVSEKLDGVRGYWDGKQLLTRQGYPVSAPQWFIADLPQQPLDGELWIGRGQFDAVSALVRSSPGDNPALWSQQWRQVKYMLFDLPQSPGTFSDRLIQLRSIVNDIDRDWIQLIDQRRLASDTELMAFLEQVVASGGEGLMLHHEDAIYKQGRSSNLLKLKLWQDAEARVIGYEPGKGKYAGMLGALLVETPTGVRFKLGSGFTDQQRKNPPEIGSLVTYKYTGINNNGVPRFASFMRIRLL